MKSNTARVLLACNFRCPFCFAAWHDDDPERIYGPGRNLDPGKDWYRRLEKIRSQGYRRIAFSGGEPTMHPEILRYIRHARRLGFESIELQTNGSLLTPDNVRKLARAGVTDALVSLHSHIPRLFDKITVTRGLFDTVVEGIKLLLAAGVNVMVSHVILKTNAPHLVDFVRFCHRELKGIREILFFSMQPEARAARNMHLWPPLPLVREVLPEALAECVRLGVAFRMDAQEGYPMCFVRGHEHRVDLQEVLEPKAVFGRDLSSFRVIERKKVKLPACRSCFFEPACYGFWEEYFVLFGTEGIEPVPRTPRLARLFPRLDAAWREPEQRPRLVRVRRKGAPAWLEEFEATQFPLPWKDAKEEARRRAVRR